MEDRIRFIRVSLDSWIESRRVPIRFGRAGTVRSILRREKFDDTDVSSRKFRARLTRPAA